MVGSNRQHGVQLMLNDPTKRTKQATNVLCYLFRNILMARQVKMMAWNTRLERYFKRNPKRDPNKDRGNLNRQLCNDEFTWQTFKRSIEFLAPKRALMTIDLKWPDGHTRRYDAYINILEDEDDTVPVNDRNQYRPEVVSLEYSEDMTTLAYIFRRILWDENIDKDKWNELLTAYVENPVTGTPQDKATLGQERNARDRDFRSTRISWNVFRRALIFLGVEHVRYTLNMTWERDQRTVHFYGHPVS